MSVPVRNAALYLPDVEAHHEPGPYQTLIDDARAKDAEYSKIWDLFAFKNDVTINLARFTQGVLRTPTTTNPALRELIAAYTSYQNECAFCTKAHATAAPELFGDEQLVWSVLGDIESSPLDDRHKALFRFISQSHKEPRGSGGVRHRSPSCGGLERRGDLLRDHHMRCSISTTAGLPRPPFPEMSPEAHRAQGKSLASRGYGRE
jgi:AhpD family alkylhydroperoxidase